MIHTLTSENHNPLTKILVVDDDRNVTSYIAELLGFVPYEVAIATSGMEALAYVAEHPVDMVLLDVMMPDLDGYDVARMMKKTFGPNNFVPIILLSALSGQQDKLTGLALADDFVTKPFDSNELLARIRVMLRIRQLQHDLYVSKSNYQFLYENAPYMYVTVNSETIITDCNTLFCKKTGVERTLAIGMNMLSFFSHDDTSSLKNYFSSLDSETPDESQRTVVLDKRITSEPVYVTLSGICTGQNENEKHVLIAMQDVTRNVLLEKEQKLARAQFYRSARLASIGTFASGVAHELNNPLTAILGFSGALLDRMKRREPLDMTEQEQYLSIINVETIRCRDIVENLSRFARDSEVQIREFALHECSGVAVKLVKSMAQKKNIGITQTIMESVLVRADIQKMEQAIVHILTNAIEFCNAGCNVAISAQVESRSVKLVISDNGPGIAAEMLPKVFDPFTTTKDVGQGMGLGLAMCHVIMEECNGAIDVVSEQGKGTTVYLEIPKA